MSIARSYAKALHDVAQNGKPNGEQLEQLEREMDGILALLTASSAARVALYSPVTSAKDKLIFVSELSKRAGLSRLMANFLGLLARKGRVGLLPEIRNSFGAVRLEAEGGILGTLVSADPMESADIEGLAKAFGAKLGKKVAFRTATDPALLAGMKVTVNGVTYDGTLRSQLQRLRDRLVYGTVNVH